MSEYALKKVCAFFIAHKDRLRIRVSDYKAYMHNTEDWIYTHTGYLNHQDRLDGHIRALLSITPTHISELSTEERNLITKHFLDLANQK